jgi:hypothetical protein
METRGSQRAVKALAVHRQRLKAEIESSEKENSPPVADSLETTQAFKRVSTTPSRIRGTCFKSAKADQNALLSLRR